MLAIGIELLNQSYEACPWDTAHVEGIVEIPPCPWRIYRAIYAGFFLVQSTGRNVKQKDLNEIILVLATTLPRYYIPPATYIQTRTFRKDRTDDPNLHKPGKMLVSGELKFNPDDSTIYIFWSVELNQEQQELLNICLNFCAYLGRRESDAVWKIQSKNFKEANCYPDPNGNLKTLVPGENFEPKHLLDNPREIFDLQRRQYVPGARWTSYILDDDTEVSNLDRDSRKFNYVKIALIANFPLPDRNTLYFSEKLHKALVQNCPDPNFTGCDRYGNYLRSNHHVYLIPVIEKGQIIAFELHCANGFTKEEEIALAKLRKLYTKLGEVVLRLVAMGNKVDYASPSRVWQSVTPMFLPRYPATLRGKPRMLSKSIYQKDGVEHQALKSLLYLPQFESNKDKNIEYKPTDLGLEQWIDGELFCRATVKVFDRYWQWKSDRDRGKKAVAEGYYVRLDFTQPKFAPIALGSAAHFGLGVFAPIYEGLKIDFDPLLVSSMNIDSS